MLGVQRILPFQQHGWVGGWVGGWPLGFGLWFTWFWGRMKKYFFLTIFSSCVRGSLFKIVFSIFCCSSFTNIQRNKWFYDMYAHYRSIFSNSLFFCMLWASFFFIADVYFYMYYGYLYRNFFQTYFALYKFFAVILYMWSLEIHSNIFYIMLFC